MTGFLIYPRAGDYEDAAKPKPRWMKDYGSIRISAKRWSVTRWTGTGGTYSKECSKHGGGVSAGLLTMKTIRAQNDQRDSKRSSSHPRPLSWRKKNTELRAFLANDASHGSAWTIHCVKTMGGHNDADCLQGKGRNLSAEVSIRSLVGSYEAYWERQKI